MSDRSTEKLGSTVIRGSGLAGAGFVLSKLLMLAAYAVVANLVTPAEFGQFAAAAILVEVSLLIADSGTTAALIHRRDRIDEAASTAVVSTLIGGLILAVLSLAASPLIGQFFESERVGTVCAAMCGVILLRELAVVPAALLQRRFSFLRRMVGEPASALAFGAVSIAATANGFGVWGLVMGFYALAVTELLSSWLLLRWRPTWSLVSFLTWRELASYGRHVFAGAAILRVGDLVPGALLGRLVGTGALGQFRYGERIATAPMQMLLAAGAYVIFPAFAAIADDAERFRNALIRTLRWVSIIAMPTALLLLPLGEPTAVLILGPEWREAGQAAAALCVYAAARVLTNVAAEAWKAIGQPQLLTRLHLTESVVAVVAVIALLDGGTVGAAIGLSVGALAGCVYASLKVRHSFDLPCARQAALVGPPALLALLVTVAILAVDRLALRAAEQGTGKGLLLLAAETIVGLLVYAAVLRFIDREVAGALSAVRASVRARLSRDRPSRV